MSLADAALRERRCSTWADLRDRFPDSPLLGGADGRSHLAYSRFKELVRELRSAFAEAGLSPGDRVASVLPNGPEAAGLFLGTALCGLCLGPLDPQLTKTELDFALLDLPAKAIVLGDGLAPVVLSLAEMSARALGLAILRLRRDPITAGDCSFSVDPGFAASDAGVLIPQSCDDVCLALHTSGTTRRPKLVALSHANLLSGALCIASTLQIGADDVVMNSLPLFHIHGLAVNVLVPAIEGALSICLSGTFDASAAIRRLKAEPQISLYSAVPTVHHAILTNLRYEDSFPALRLIRNCSAHLPAMLASSVSERMGTEVLPTYAMTESMPIASPTPHGGCHGVEKERHKPSTHSSLGFAAGPEIRLLTTNGLEEPAQNISGEICVRGACVTRGYEAREGHDPNQEAFLQGWLKTGDLATVSQNGLILTGRCKEVINKAGEKFSPLQIEEVFLQHPDVEDCVAFAALCEKRGEAIGLAVQARNEQSLDGLRMFGRRTQELRVAALPDCVVWLKELPRTATGKKLRVGLGEKLGLPKLQGDHGEWYADAAGPFDGYGTFTLRPAERFAVRESGSQDLRTVRKIAVDLARCELEDDEPLLDSGLDSLSATTFINALELQLHISLAGEDGAVAFLDSHPSLKLVAAAAAAAQTRRLPTPCRPYLGPGRPDLKQFVVDARDPGSVLHAAQHSRADVIRTRCSEMSPDAEVDRNGLTALHYAAGRGDLQICRLLLELGAGVDTRNKDLRTPLMWAARNGHVEACEELVRRKADIHAANKLGICCLHWAAWGGSLDAVAYLLDQAADINAVCNAGCNVAVWAATAGSYDMCLWLHEKRADFASTNKNGHGVLNKAAWRGHSVKLMTWMLGIESIEEQLFEQDWDGELPVDRARQKGHTALAEWLHQQMCARRPSWQEAIEKIAAYRLREQPEFGIGSMVLSLIAFSGCPSTPLVSEPFILS
ncbi:unnamed protein product [Effrenium voratum]|nr:unnamed protein product [Effrenium voratum]